MYLPLFKDNYLPRTAQMDAKPPNFRSRTPKMRSRTPKMRSRTQNLRSRTPKMRLGTPKMRLAAPSLNTRTPNLHLRTASLYGETAFVGSGRYFREQKSPADAGECFKGLGYRCLERAFLYLYPSG